MRALHGPGSGGGPSFPGPATVGALGAIVLAGAGLNIGVRVLQRDDRTWPVWLGTATCAVVLLFWVVLAVGEMVSPH